MELGVGALYARRYFNKEAKNKVMEMMVYIQAAFAKLLQEIDWMDDVTRENALQKTNTMTSYVAYSDELYDDKKLEEYYANVIFANDVSIVVILKTGNFSFK